jgi:hypothetical protein
MFAGACCLPCVNLYTRQPHAMTGVALSRSGLALTLARYAGCFGMEPRLSRQKESSRLCTELMLATRSKVTWRRTPLLPRRPSSTRGLLRSESEWKAAPEHYTRLDSCAI